MKVIFQTQLDLLAKQGGDNIKLTKIRESLERKGIETFFSIGHEIDLSPYDIVHIFKVTDPKETYQQILNAKRQKKKIAITPIYWSREGLEDKDFFLEEVYEETLRDRLRNIKDGIALKSGHLRKSKLMTFLINNLHRKTMDYKHISETLKMADIILPSSEKEMRMIIRDFSLDSSKKFHLVANAVDTALFSFNAIALMDAYSNSFYQKFGIKDYILCVGRIEKRKNQVGLLRSLQNISSPVVLLGTSSNDEYYQYVKKLLRPCALMIDSWPLEKMQEVYSLARVHASPSLYDRPGLSSLEAGSLGVNIVVGSGGSEREYFGDFAEYCDPFDSASINTALKRAIYNVFPNRSLSRYIRENFSWEKAALQTIEAYKEIIG